MPNLKHVKITSEQGLRSWLSKYPGQEQSVLLVTYTKSSGDKHVTHEQVQDAIAEYGWVPGRRYTLNAHLIGHVISRELA